MTPVFTSFYTAGTAYKQEADELVRTLEAHRLVYDVRAIAGRGSWVKNCAAKPEFVRDRMLDHEGRAVVWVDADARVKRQPTLLSELTADFAAHWLDGKELLSGTLYFAPTPNAWKLVQAWVAECQRNPEEWDQRSLQKIIDTIPGLTIHRLPESYTAIFDRGLADDVTILHTQASRRLRNTV